MRGIAIGATLGLFLPFLGQWAGGMLWGSGPGPLSVFR